MKKSVLILLIPLTLILLTALVAAGPLETLMSGFFGFLGLASSTWSEITIVIIIFIMLAFAFSDIIKITTLFSPFVAYIIGFGLAVIAALTGLVVQIAYVAMAFTAGLGVLSVVISLISAFVVWILIHLGVANVGKWLSRRKAYMKAYEKGTDVTAGASFLKEVGGWAKK
jgi:hypothetical protein